MLQTRQGVCSALQVSSAELAALADKPHALQSDAHLGNATLLAACTENAAWVDIAAGCDGANAALDAETPEIVADAF